MRRRSGTVFTYTASAVVFSCLLLSLYKQPSSSSYLSASNSRPVVAIVACSKSLNSWTSVEDTTLFKQLMPSIEKTVTLKERERFAVELVLGVDSDDNFDNYQ